MEKVVDADYVTTARSMSTYVQEGPFRGIFKEFNHDVKFLTESHFNAIKSNHISRAKEGVPFTVEQTHIAWLHDQKELTSKLTIDVKIDHGLFIITMDTEEENLFSNSVFKTRSPIGLETYIQGNIAVWIQAFVNQVKKQLDEENENIRLKLEAEAIEKSKRRV